MSAASAQSGKVPIADRVHDLLLAQFMDGTRTAGEPLNIAALSEELEVSRTPLREALARLEYTGLIRREALKGYRVSPVLSERELVKLMDARLLLEPALAFEAGNRTTPEFLAELLAGVEDMDEAGKGSGEGGFRVYWTADEAFHGLISKQSDNPFLEAAYGALGWHVHRFRLLAETGSSHAQFAAKDHRAIYDALSNRDPELAAQRMREHITNARSRALKDRHSIRS
jgi:DNA-binding GntR family transcriptional regulator